jgi:lipid-binding SYLF domain-containing protein
MSNNLWVVSIAGLSLILPALASNRSDDSGRVPKVTQVFQEIMRTPDQGIPQELLETAKCVAISPGEEKAAFIFGGSYGKGWRPAALRMARVLRCFLLSGEGASTSRSAALSPTW